MKQKILVVAIVASASLSACGNPASNSTGTEQSTQGSFDSAVHWVKKIVHGWTAKASVQIPAQGAIADALLDPAFAGNSNSLNGAFLREVMQYLKGDFQEILLTKAAVGAADLPQNAKSEVPYLMPVAAITSAYRGWQISMMDMSAFGEPEATPAQKKMYMGFQEAAVRYTNDLFTQIAMQLNDEVGVMDDPEMAKSEIQRIYKSIPASTKKAIWKAAVSHSDTVSRTADLSGTKGVDWSTSDGSSYSGNADGLSWTKSGIAWYGKGALSGKQWTFGLESSVSKSRDKSTDGSESVSGSSGESTSNKAEPK